MGFSCHFWEISKRSQHILTVLNIRSVAQVGSGKSTLLQGILGEVLPHWHCCCAWQVGGPRDPRDPRDPRARGDVTECQETNWSVSSLNHQNLGIYMYIYIYIHIYIYIMDLWYFGGNDMSLMKEWRWVDCRFQFNYRPWPWDHDAKSQGSPTALNNLGFAMSPWGKTSYLVKLWTWNLGEIDASFAGSRQAAGGLC